MLIKIVNTIDIEDDLKTLEDKLKMVYILYTDKTEQLDYRAKKQ